MPKKDFKCIKMTLPPPEERFMGCIEDLIDVVKDCLEYVESKGYNILPPTLVSLAGAVIQRYDNRYITETFIKYSYMYWDEIRIHNEAFFDEHAHKIFQELPLGNIDSFKKLFNLVDSHGKKVINQEYRDDIWAMFESLVKISINYIHESRELVNNNYKYEFCEYVNIKDEANKWNMNLKSK
jgi:hypothetical protein